MKVILLKDIRGVGQRHEIKDVADGYAANFLFPNKAAEPATEAKLQQLKVERTAHEAEAQKQEGELLKKIETLRGKNITLQARATEKGGLFKAITVKDIAKTILTEHSLEIPESVVGVETPIKTTGAHMVVLKHHQTKVPLEVVVVAA